MYIVYIIIYNIVYIILYIIIYSILYNIVYSIVYNIVYSIVYIIVYSIFYTIVYKKVIAYNYNLYNTLRIMYTMLYSIPQYIYTLRCNLEYSI